MTFRAEELLWLLLLVPALAAMAASTWWIRRRQTARFGNEELTRSLVRGRAGPWRALRGVLFVLGIALAMVALAGPQYGSRTRMLRKRGIDIVVALDFSKSMLAQDVRPSRIERAKAELGRFLEELGGSRVGLVAFAGETMEFPLTDDYGAVQLFLRGLAPYDMPVGGTVIGRALTAAGDLLERSATRSEAPEPEPAAEAQPDRVVVLLTDGEDHEGDPVEAARRLAESGVRVYTIGIGSRSGEPIPTYSPDGTWTGYMRNDSGDVVTTALSAENEAQLRRVAEVSGGRYFRAGKGSVGVDKIRAEIRQMKQRERDARRVTVHEDRYALVLLPAFLLLVLEGLLPEAWLRRKRARAEGGTA